MEQQCTTSNERSIELSLAPKNYDGAENTSFTPQQVKASSLKDVFTAYNYSQIIWAKDYRLKDNFSGAKGFCLDIDGGMKISEAEDILKARDLNYALITTRSHSESNPRFRIFVPFTHNIHSLLRYQAAAHKLDELFGGKCDPAVFDGARFLFGSPEDAYFSSNWTGHDFDVSEFVGYDLTSVPSNEGDWDDNLVVSDADGNAIPVASIKEKTRVLCPFHDDHSSSAFVEYSSTSGNWFIHCSACNRTFWKTKKPVPPEERLANYWSHSTGIYEAGIVGDSFYFSKIDKEKFLTLADANSKEDQNEVYKWVVKNHHIPMLARIDFLGNPDIEKPEFLVKKDDGIIEVKFPIIPVHTADNQFIEDYLDRTFGPRKKVIKEYLAVYAYTNYQKLPSLILVGKRGSGKNTFADMVADIYRPLSVYWKPEEGSFNPELQKKLLIADETVTKDIKNYTYLKRLSGQAYQTINEKYTPKYQVRNNINIIILSNRNLPIFADREELPTDPANNQFFVYEMKKFSGRIDADLSNKLRRYLGHYVRTELKKVFSNLNMSGFRYSIEVPITDEEKLLFNSSVSSDEAAADRFLRYIADNHGSNPKWDFKDHIASGFVPMDEIYKNMGGDDNLKAKVLRNLREREFLTSDTSSKRSKGGSRLYCYQMTPKFAEWLEKEVGTACVHLEQAPEQAPKNAEFSMN